MIHTIAYEFSLFWFQNGSYAIETFSFWRHIICIINLYLVLTS